MRVAERGRENGTTSSLSMDVVKLLKTQDLGYLQMVLQQTRRERERAEKETVIAGVGVDIDLSATLPSKRTTFDEEGNSLPVAVTADVESDDEDGNMSLNKGLPRDEIRRNRRKRRSQEVISQRLGMLLAREKDLSRALVELQDQKAKMHNTVGGTNSNGTKFKIRERKR